MLEIIIFFIRFINIDWCNHNNFNSPLFPPIARDKNIPSSLIGATFSFNPVGALASSFFVGKFMDNVKQIQKQYFTQHNKYTFIRSGTLIQSLGIFYFSLTYYMEGFSFIMVAISSRIINGFVIILINNFVKGYSMFIIPYYSNLPKLSPDPY